MSKFWTKFSKFWTKFWNFYLFVFFLLIMTNIAFKTIADRDLYFLLIGFIVSVFLILVMIVLWLMCGIVTDSNSRKEE